jgi:hypothetical protein
MFKFLPHIIFTVIGLAALSVSGILVWRARSFEQRALLTEGVVVAQSEYRTDKGERAWRSDLEWKDREGRSHHQRLHSDSNATYPVGTKRSLRYDPGDVEDARFEGSSDTAAMIFGTIGLVFLGLVVKVVTSQEKTA